MKIIRLSTFLDFGGIESKMVNLSVNKNDGIDMAFWAIGKGGDAENKIIKNNKKVECFNLSHKIPSFLTIYKLYLKLKKEKPDVIHTSGAEANFHGVISARLAKVPIVIAEEIGIPKQSLFAKLVFKFIYNISNFIVTESQQVMDNLKGNFTLPDHKLKVIPNFTVFHKNTLKKESFSSDCFTIATVSRLEPVKNIESIIKVVARLKKENYLIHYNMVGDGSLKESLQNMILDNNLENEIIMIGYKENPKPYLLDADLYVLNSFSEGFSNSLLEAMYLNVPSLTTDVGGAIELIKDGVTGWVVGVDEIDNLYLKLKHIINMNKEERLKIGLNGKKHVEENFSLENHLNKLMEIYS